MAHSFFLDTGKAPGYDAGHGSLSVDLWHRIG
ncbi:unnamed protein product, partial [marine sediment metagenome]